jgi:hypothetical protein
MWKQRPGWTENAVMGSPGWGIKGTVVGRMDANEAIFKRILDNEEFRQVLLEWYATKVYRSCRRGEPKQCPSSTRRLAGVGIIPVQWAN